MVFIVWMTKTHPKHFHDDFFQSFNGFCFLNGDAANDIDLRKLKLDFQIVIVEFNLA